MSFKEHYIFGEKLAFHTAPTLLGIKCASLMSLKKGEYDITSNAEIFNRRAASRGLKIKMLCECEKRVLILVYNCTKLAARLNTMECRRLLSECGYTDDMDMHACIERLSQRIAAENDFPHEIGIFLDYPIEDVIGFIRNKGCDYKLCGYWKVYGNTEKAQRTFENYNKCRKYLCNKLSEGQDLCRALKLS